MHVEGRFLPQEVRLLLPEPVSTLIGNFNLEIPEHARKDQAKLCIRKTKTSLKASLSIFCLHFSIYRIGDVTYFMPIQFRGPYENGWK